MTDIKLREFAEGPLWYEIDMLFETISALTSKEYEDNRILHNSLVESFVIHARNLYEFLTVKKSSWEDIVIAKNFCDDPMIWGPVSKRWRQEAQSSTKHFDAERANRAVAHLSKDRLAYKAVNESKKWNCVTIGRKLLSMLKIFLNHASSSKISSKFQQNINALENRFDFLTPSEAAGLPVSAATIANTTSVAHTEARTEVSTIAPSDRVFGRDRN